MARRRIKKVGPCAVAGRCLRDTGLVPERLGGGGPCSRRAAKCVYAAVGGGEHRAAEDSEDRSDTISVFNGPPPMIYQLKSESEEINTVAKWIGDQARARPRSTAGSTRTRSFARP
jgi:hypothetical protein